MPYSLHVFPFSNYCEKAVWALDAVGADYKTVTHYPGPHARAIKKLSGQTAVPVLVDGGDVIAGSAALIEHAFSQHLNNSLVPAHLASDIAAWQRRLDNIGGTLRGTLFYDILPNPGLSISLLTDTQKPAFSGYGLFFRAMIPMLKRMLKDKLPDADAARIECREVLSDIARASEKTGYLIGDHFTLADLTAAAIFFPICMPQEAPGHRFANNNSELEQWYERWKDNPAIPYIQNIYKKHRHV